MDSSASSSTTKSTGFFSMEARCSSSDVVLLEQEKPSGGGVGVHITQTLSNSSETIFQSMERQNHSRVLTLGLVLPIYYFLTCGGPAGIEPVVQSGGPLYGLISLVAFPVLFSTPFALLISEMCTAFPDDGELLVLVVVVSFLVCDRRRICLTSTS